MMITHSRGGTTHSRGHAPMKSRAHTDVVWKIKYIQSGEKGARCGFVTDASLFSLFSLRGRLRRRLLLASLCLSLSSLLKQIQIPSFISFCFFFFLSSVPFEKCSVATSYNRRVNCELENSFCREFLNVFQHVKDDLRTLYYEKRDYNIQFYTYNFLICFAPWN